MSLYVVIEAKDLALFEEIAALAIPKLPLNKGINNFKTLKPSPLACAECEVPKLTLPTLDYESMQARNSNLHFPYHQP